MIEGKNGSNDCAANFQQTEVYQVSRRFHHHGFIKLAIGRLHQNIGSTHLVTTRLSLLRQNIECNAFLALCFAQRHIQPRRAWRRDGLSFQALWQNWDGGCACCIRRVSGVT